MSVCGLSFFVLAVTTNAKSDVYGPRKRITKILKIGNASSNNMKILFFAHLEQLTRQSELCLELEQPLSVHQLWERLFVRFPDLKAYRDSTRVSCNWSFVDDDAMLQPGDEVALIPPVSGG